MGVVAAPAPAPVRRFLDSEINSNGARDAFRPLEPTIRTIVIGRLLSEEHWKQAGQLVAGRPDIHLRLCPGFSPDLKFLRHFPGLRSLCVAIYGLESLEGLEHVAGTLESFDFEATRKVFALDFLDDMPELTELNLERGKKGVERLGRLARLEALGLRGLTPHSLENLLPLQNLRALSLAMGGPCDLSLLKAFPRLEELTLLRIAGLSDLSVLSETPGLRKLILYWLKNVMALPSLAMLSHLEEVDLETMKGLTSLASIATAPALQEFQIVTTPQLHAEHFACFAGHPSLRRLMAYPGGKKVNDEIKRMFPGIAV
jgi:hypothetical protein